MGTGREPAAVDVITVARPSSTSSSNVPVFDGNCGSSTATTVEPLIGGYPRPPSAAGRSSKRSIPSYRNDDSIFASGTSIEMGAGLGPLHLTPTPTPLDPLKYAR